MAKAVLCKEFGPPESLTIEHIELPPPGPKQVLIEVAACSVNFPDALIVQGKYQYKPPFPFSPGCEVSGVIKQVGDQIENFKIGDHVIAFPAWGGYAEEVVVDCERVVAIAATVDPQIAACIALTYGTSHYALKDRANIQAGESLLVLGAAGGVGLAAIECGKALGARVIAAASSDKKLNTCREHGADEVINYERDSLREQIKALTDGKGVDVVYDPVGAEYTEPALRGMAWNGRFLIIGFAAGQIAKIPMNLPLLKGCSIVGVFWGAFTSREPAQNQANLAQLVTWLEQGKINPHIDQVLPMEQAVDALQRMLNREVRGKLVLVN